MIYSKRNHQQETINKTNTTEKQKLFQNFTLRTTRKEQRNEARMEQELEIGAERTLKEILA